MRGSDPAASIESAAGHGADSLSSCPFDPFPGMAVVIEAATVSAGPGGPDAAVFSCLDADGARRWVGSTDATAIERISTTDPAGTSATITARADGALVTSSL